jgi:two-component system, LytTR family, sensor kinase
MALKLVDRIPRIWTRAYLLICLWYAINFALSAFFEWRLFRPFTYVLWGGFFLFEALCLLIIGIFVYAHWLNRFHYYVQIAGHLVGIVVFFFTMGSLSYYFTDYLDGLVYYENWKDYMTGLLSWEALRFHDQYIITVGVYYVIRYFEGLQRQNQEKSDLALRNKEMQISLLKSQINPHFLFNTLNSISTLMNSSKDQARKMITQLSEVFRYSLDSHKTETVELSKEIHFIENYIRIQQVRFGERLRFEKLVDSECLSLHIPPMILQPLIENSVKYGIAPKEEGGKIQLIVKPEGDKIYFEVRDDGLGSKAKKVMDSGSGSGVGMANTEMRLKSYYGSDARLRVVKSEAGYSVSFKITALHIPTQDEFVQEVYHY